MTPVGEHIWLVTFMPYDLGSFDESKRMTVSGAAISSDRIVCSSLFAGSTGEWLHENANARRKHTARRADGREDLARANALVSGRWFELRSGCRDTRDRRKLLVLQLEAWPSLHLGIAIPRRAWSLKKSLRGSPDTVPLRRYPRQGKR